MAAHGAFENLDRGGPTVFCGLLKRVQATAVTMPWQRIAGILPNDKEGK